MVDELTNLILKKDLAAIDLARMLGSAGGESVRPLITNEDAAVRQIAIYSAYETRMSGLPDALVPLLTDESPSVRTAALNVISKTIDSSIYPSLLQIFAKVPDADDRQQLALLIGKMPVAQIADLIILRDNESDAAARTGCVVALAGLGHNESRHEFLASLNNATGQSLRRYLEFAEYIAQPWLLRSLSRVLTNQEPLVFIGSHHAPGPGPDHLRACDLAVDLITKITGARFSFATNQAANYTDTQLKEVLDYTNR